MYNYLFRRILINFIFYLHFIVFLLFPLGFLIPSSIWPARIEYHFWYNFSLFLLFYLWGLVWTIKFRNKIYSICILDTITQKLRGYSMWDPQNYDHSFVEELLSKFGLMHIPKRSIPELLLACTIVSAIFYILKLYEIVLY